MIDDCLAHRLLSIALVAVGATAAVAKPGLSSHGSAVEDSVCVGEELRQRFTVDGILRHCDGRE